MIDDLLKPLLSGNGASKVKLTRDGLILLALAYIAIQVTSLDKRLALVEYRLNAVAAAAPIQDRNGTDLERSTWTGLRK